MSPNITPNKNFGVALVLACTAINSFIARQVSRFLYFEVTHLKSDEVSYGLNTVDSPIAYLIL